MNNKINKVVIFINHPSQYYIFKNIIACISDKSIKIKIFIKNKEILEILLKKDGCLYKKIYEDEKRDGIASLIVSVFKKNRNFFRELKRFNPDIMISCASDVAQVGFLLGIPSIVLNDDDAKIVPFSAYLGWPFAHSIVAPKGCKMGYWRKKTVFYDGYQKLAYLSPKYFEPNKNKIKKYGLLGQTYFLIRSVALTAHHDRNIRGLTGSLIDRLIEIMSPYGKVFISSEKKLPSYLESYKLSINPLDIHHLIFSSSLLVGDSQSMAQEAAILGTPSIRFNDFVGKIGVLEELEHKYGLTFGISPDNPEMLIEKVKSMIAFNDRIGYRARAQKMIESMIDLPSLLAWLIEEYPDSKKTLMENPDFQYRFI